MSLRKPRWDLVARLSGSVTALLAIAAGAPYATASDIATAGNEKVQAVKLFTDISGKTIHSNITVIQTNGHTSTGLGGATYVADALADASLAAAHPQACVATANGRYFRLVGDAEGFITPEQVGCAAYSAGTNQQVAIQRALNYGKAASLKGAKFPAPVYELWVPTRTSAFTDAVSNDGHYLVVDQWACSLVATSARGTRFDCKGPTGGSALTDYVVLNSPTYGGNVIWRGSAVKMTGTVSTGSANPGDAALTHLTMRGIEFYTGITASLNTAWPCHPPSRTPGQENAWDISMKGVFCQNDKLIGNITLIDCTFDGFLGENVYCGGGLNSNQKLTVRNMVSKNSNGTSVNPNGPRMTDVIGLYVENCAGVIEGWLGWDVSQFLAVRAKKVLAGGELKGGYEYNGSLRGDGTLPWATVDVTVEGVSAACSLYLGNFVRGQVKLIDAYARVYQQSGTMLVENLNVDLTVTAHLYNISRAVHYIGYDATSTGIKNTTIRLDVRRTAEAQAAGRWVNNAFEQGYSIGTSNYLYVQGYAPSMGAVTSPATNYVAVVDRGVDKGWGTFGTSFDPTTTASPEWGSHFLRCSTFAGGAGVYQVNLPATTMFQEGDEIGITHRTSNSVFVELVDGGTKKGIIGYRDTMRFRCNKAQVRWDVIEGTGMRVTTGAVDIASTAAAAESAAVTVSIPGLRPYHSLEFIPPSLLTGFVLSAIRAETDQVKLWFRNIDGGGTLDPSSVTGTFRWGIKP